VMEAVALQSDLGRILSADVWTSAALHEGNPGMLHYGCHGVETIYALMGTGCVEVRTVFTPGGDIAIGTWSDGRIGSVRGIRDGKGGFGYAAHYENGHHTGIVNGAAFYSEMLKRVVEMFATKNPPIPYAESREIVAFMDAALVSQNNGGAPALVSQPGEGTKQ
jgi:hypothetical protein